jgi:hypothetical protein
MRATKISPSMFILAVTSISLLSGCGNRSDGDSPQGTAATGPQSGSSSQGIPAAQRTTASNNLPLYGTNGEILPPRTSDEARRRTSIPLDIGAERQRSGEQETTVDRDINEQILLRLQQGGFSTQLLRNIQVTSHGGVVTLRGKVANQEEKRRVEEMIKTAPGVAAVTNELRVVSGK